jgi:hypothetical protein
MLFSSKNTYPPQPAIMGRLKINITIPNTRAVYEENRDLKYCKSNFEGVLAISIKSSNVPLSRFGYRSTTKYPSRYPS